MRKGIVKQFMPPVAPRNNMLSRSERRFYGQLLFQCAKRDMPIFVAAQKRAVSCIYGLLGVDGADCAGFSPPAGGCDPAGADFSPPGADCDPAGADFSSPGAGRFPPETGGDPCSWTGAFPPDNFSKFGGAIMYTEIMQRMIQKAATPMVIRVNKSPAFEPKALCPPMPPSAPANPPPLPRWMRIKTIKKTAVKTKTIIIKTCQNVIIISFNMCPAG
jgi:hypothetical protein